MHHKKHMRYYLFLLLFIIICCGKNYPVYYDDNFPINSIIFTETAYKVNGDTKFINSWYISSDKGIKTNLYSLEKNIGYLSLTLNKSRYSWYTSDKQGKKRPITYSIQDAVRDEINIFTNLSNMVRIGSDTDLNDSNARCVMRDFSYIRSDFINDTVVYHYRFIEDYGNSYCNLDVWLDKHKRIVKRIITQGKDQNRSQIVMYPILYNMSIPDEVFNIPSDITFVDTPI
jgi:hypothetical protein